MKSSEPGGESADVEILTFGCRLNIVESEAMAAAARAAGERNLLIVNSCAVTADAARDVARAIRRRKRERPELRIVATGCAVEIEPVRFAEMPEIERIVPNARKVDPEVWAGSPAGRAQSPPTALVRPVHTRGFLDVQNGCDHRCTFCIIPFGRGPSRSRSIEDVVARAVRSVEEGRKELVLTGVDLTSWGSDLPGAPKLGHLVEAILRGAPGLARLRLSSLDCAEADDALRAAFAEEERLMPHLHLSLQAGSDLILKRMKRRHSRADAVQFCRDLRRLRPGVAIGADLIVGFPTETEAMFQETLALVDDCGLSFLHVFPFSPRPGTPAARMPATSPDVIKERAARLRARGDAALADRLSNRVGSVARVLVEQGDRGHDEDFTRVITPSETARGEIVDLWIEKSTGRDLVGRLATTHRRAGEPAYAAAAAP